MYHVKHVRLVILLALVPGVLLVSCKSETATLFESMPSSTTGISFTNKLEKKPLFNLLYYLYYYNGGGVGIGDINNDSLPDVFLSANSKGNNKLYINKGNFVFEDITEKAGVKGNSDWCTGVTMGDVNSDGKLDIYVSSVNNKYGLTGHNELFINNGNNTFTEKSREYGLDFAGYTTQSAFFDYDRDGDLDCYILNQSHHPHANIADTMNRRKFDPYSGDRLYRNEFVSNGQQTGQARFTDVSAAAGIFQSNLGYGLGLGIGDINNDGWDDVYIGNDFHENDYYYVNNGNGTFTESSAKVFDHYSRFSMGNDIADYNNDGHLDVVTVDMLPPDEKVLKTYGSDENPDIYKVKLEIQGYQKQYSKNCLHRNNGDGTSFSETALLSGVSATDWSWAPLFADFNNDGYKDLFITSGIVKRPVDLDYVRFVSDLQLKKGSMNKTDKYDDEALGKMPDGRSHPFFFGGSGGHAFTDLSKSWGTAGITGYSNGAAYGDLDNDGDLDLVVNNLEAEATVLRNNNQSNHFISISFSGKGPNTFGVGAKAYVFTKDRMQYQQLMLTRGFESSCDTRLHFGLNLFISHDSVVTVDAIDSILIVWPNQQFQVLRNVRTNQHLVVEQEMATGTFNHSDFFKPVPALLTEVTNPLNINWRHRENDFLDYNVQYLIPHGQSDRGPKVAVADVNGDGLDDMYVCGALGQPGNLLLQQSTSNFSASDTGVFNPDALFEDVDAVFFDANGDKAPDLYVASGGNQYSGASPYLVDRLYINDGKGHFTKSGSLPAIVKNKSCVRVADVDKDGDQDLFVGVLADAQAFGVPQSSAMLLNDGKGNFTVTSNNVIALDKIGIVTSAEFADINKDGWPDLVVGGEWMPLQVYMNENGKFRASPLANSTGLWQTVHVDDVNGDGNLDILAGNWGWNNKFWSGKNGPMRMYVADFDRNGRTEQLVSYTLDGVEYPFLAKDEVERPLPTLKKHYLYYAEYAGIPMKDVFYGWIDTIQPFMAERLGSVVCFGDGKGNFTISDLPADLQLAPIFSFQKIQQANNETTWLAGGNFFNVIPYEGRYDAQPLALFRINNNKEIKYIHQPELSKLPGQVRDTKWLNLGKDGRVLVVARNNDVLKLYKTDSSRNQIMVSR